jgi:hypothetical protein
MNGRYHELAGGIRHGLRVDRAARALASGRGPSERAALCSALGNQAGIVSSLGRNDEALLVITEALDTTRELAEADPGWIAGLAAWLSNRGLILRTWGMDNANANGRRSGPAPRASFELSRRF